jgi:hypothetical protein
VKRPLKFTKLAKVATLSADFWPVNSQVLSLALYFLSQGPATRPGKLIKPAVGVLGLYCTLCCRFTEPMSGERVVDVDEASLRIEHDVIYYPFVEKYPLVDD